MLLSLALLLPWVAVSVDGVAMCWLTQDALTVKGSCDRIAAYWAQRPETPFVGRSLPRHLQSSRSLLLARSPHGTPFSFASS